MAKMQCWKCGFEFRYVSAGRRGRLTMDAVAKLQTCPVVQERMKAAGGTLTGDDTDCPHIMETLDRGR